MTDKATSGQSVQKSPEGLFLQDGIEGLHSLPRHSVDMLLTDPPYGTTRNFWDVPLPLPELWEAVKWAVKPEGAVLFFAQCPYDKVLGASNLSMLRYALFIVRQIDGMSHSDLLESSAKCCAQAQHRHDVDFILSEYLLSVKGGRCRFRSRCCPRWNCTVRTAGCRSP